MAVDMFLQLDPIKGESQDHKHKNEIEIVSFSWGMVQAATFHSGTGGGAGKVSVQDLSLTKFTDKASTDLMMACARGDHIAKGVLTCRKAGGKDAIDYLKVTMDKILVTSWQGGGSAHDDRQHESISLNFQKVKVEYKQQLDTGAAGASPTFSMDIAASKVT